MRPILLLVCLATLVSDGAAAQRPSPPSRADSLRGAIDAPARRWWDVTFYDLQVEVHPADSSVRGSNAIVYKVVAPARLLQLDLREPLELDSVVQEGKRLAYRRDGNAFFVSIAATQRVGEIHRLVAYYHGRPRAAQRAPWDGGFVWATDSVGRPWIASAVQGFGASGWWPNKDTQADEPDSQRVAITIPDPTMDVSNGRLTRIAHHPNGTTTYEWFVSSPINNYDVAVNAGGYAHLADVFEGEAGPLALDYYPLSYHVAAAWRQFAQVPSMLQCFEHWFGPYPWYEDGYKLVETPHLGMEHQSAVAYGNHYANGYLGRDLSASGWGLRWDFIIVHESAHEWFGNSLTAQDIADTWIHESFANYSENLYTECLFGPQAGASYVIGTRKLIRNDVPILGEYGVNREGSGDVYYKGGNMLHTIRQVVNDDEKWRAILRGMNATFRHQVLTGAQLQRYMSERSGLDLAPVFAQYLGTTRVPVFEYKVVGTTLSYRWADVVPGFVMPVRVSLDGGALIALHPSTTWQEVLSPVHDAAAVRVDENFYVLAREVSAHHDP
ncbi:MAG: M1 family metallopeptidase [Gemmatimonadota bacterium]